jgi:Ni,Fe-hydrogenase III large subunit
MSNINEQQIVEEVPKAQVSKGKAPKKQTAGSSNTSTTNDEISQNVASLKVLVEELTKRVQELETRVSELETGNKSSNEVQPTKQKAGKANNEEKKPRAPTAYNLFMKEKMTELKESHPSLTNIERMKMAAEAWSQSKQ